MMVVFNPDIGVLIVSFYFIPEDLCVMMVAFNPDVGVLIV
jgi:hypothetical protein